MVISKGPAEYVARIVVIDIDAMLPALHRRGDELKIEEGVAEWPYSDEPDNTVIGLSLELKKECESDHGGQYREAKREISNARGHYDPQR
jgi:hypothetical protein